MAYGYSITYSVVLGYRVNASTVYGDYCTPVPGEATPSTFWILACCGGNLFQMNNLSKTTRIIM